MIIFQHVTCFALQGYYGSGDDDDEGPSPPSYCSTALVAPGCEAFLLWPHKLLLHSCFIVKSISSAMSVSGKWSTCQLNIKSRQVVHGPGFYVLECG